MMMMMMVVVMVVTAKQTGVNRSGWRQIPLTRVASSHGSRLHTLSWGHAELYVLEDGADDGEEGGGDGDDKAEDRGYNAQEVTLSQSCSLYSIPLCLSATIF